MKINTIENLKNRKSEYILNKDVKVSEDEIIRVVEDSFYYSPSAFNSESSKSVILLGKEHDYLWEEITLNVLKSMISDEEQLKEVEEKIYGFKNAYGTVLVFEDIDIVKGLQESFPSYSENFPIWSEQASGMATIIAWTALTELGLGANLQHYNPIIDEKVYEKWDIPRNWKLRSQLVFGNIFEKAGDKEKEDIKERVLVRK